MPQQTVPDIDFDYFALGDIADLFANDKIFVNEAYQRGDIWKHTQKVELIKSIEQRYSIGVLVLFINDAGQFEVLDGQQRLLTIKGYLEGKLDLTDTEITPYNELGSREKKLQDAYCIFYLKLKSHDPESKEEDIVQTFLRLQEGTPLNKAEKINAYRGVFKDTFRMIRETHPIFNFLGTEKRFRLRQLAAELLLLELDGDYDNKIFPSLDIVTMVEAVQKYDKKISKQKLRFYIGNLDYMVDSLNMLLGAFKFRDVISFYLLVSFLRKKRAGNQNLRIELAAFARIFMQKLNMFSIYDTNPPKGMTREEFNTYKKYKQESKLMTTPSSFSNRLEIMISEFNRLIPIIHKDPQRLYDLEQKRILFFRQQGICPECNKSLDFKTASGHHEITHSAGGKPDEFKTSWNPHDRVRSARRSRNFVLDSFLSHAVDGIDMYMTSLNKSPKPIEDPKFSLIFEKAQQSVFNKIFGFYEYFDLNKSLIGLVLLLITWRNNLTHFYAENIMPPEFQEVLLKDKEEIQIDYCNLEIEKILDKANFGETLTFKEVASLINATHKFVEEVDMKVLNKMDIKKYAQDVLNNHYKTNQKSKLKSRVLSNDKLKRFELNILQNEAAFDIEDYEKFRT